MKTDNGMKFPDTQQKMEANMEIQRVTFFCRSLSFIKFNEFLRIQGVLQVIS